MMKQSGVQKWIYDELREINNTAFEYKENTSCISSYISKCTKNLHYYPLQDILRVSHLYSNYDEDLIHSLLD
jgi:secreted Zn-dependent insulinase-like peptidase